MRWKAKEHILLSMLLKILVVEDYEPFRRVISSLLQHRAEFQVFEAFDGLEAVQKAGELQPDLILLDIGLPKLNGLEAFKQIRRLAPNAQILFVTQESSPLWCERLLAWAH
jgi:CheY-like chemotaxis protein